MFCLFMNYSSFLLYLLIMIKWKMLFLIMSIIFRKQDSSGRDPSMTYDTRIGDPEFSFYDKYQI